jgi:hypothetical protein
MERFIGCKLTGRRLRGHVDYKEGSRDAFVVYFQRISGLNAVAVFFDILQVAGAKSVAKVVRVRPIPADNCEVHFVLLAHWLNSRLI